MKNIQRTIEVILPDKNDPKLEEEALLTIFELLADFGLLPQNELDEPEESK